MYFQLYWRVSASVYILYLRTGLYTANTHGWKGRLYTSLTRAGLEDFNGCEFTEDLYISHLHIHYTILLIVQCRHRFFIWYAYRCVYFNLQMADYMLRKNVYHINKLMHEAPSSLPRFMSLIITTFPSEQFLSEKQWMY